MSGYWLIVAGALRDATAQADYVERWKPLAERYGARISVLDAASTLRETGGHSRVLVVAFDSYETAVACYEDAQYQVAKGFAIQAAPRELLILRGTPPQA